MVKKLLKKKLKIVSLKKLKTIKRTKTLLGEWAKKQIIKKSTKGLKMFYPKHCVTNLFLQKKHLINLVTNNFSHTRLNHSKMENANLLDKFTLADNQHIFSNITTRHNPIDILVNPIGKIKPKAGNSSIRAETKASLHGWEAYCLSLKSITKKERFNNWKNLYSLDQLMAYQHEKTFRRKSSAYRVQLMETQKLTALYGRLSKAKLLGSSATHFSGAISRKASYLPLLLERRLDVSVKRCFMFNTLRCARHWISQGRIYLNGQKVTTPSVMLNPGDIFSIASYHRENFKRDFLDNFYKLPKESKFIQSGTLVSRWREWALLYNLSKKHYNCDTRQNLLKVKANTKQPLVGKTKQPLKVSWPDKGIKNFWYLSGRYPYKLISNVVSNSYNISKQLSLIRWLAKQRWPRINSRFTHWKAIYRRRIAVFSRWLLSQTYLTCDGLYFLRWHRAFIRKKSKQIFQEHRRFGLAKPLHFEVSYKNLSALYLYPPQKILWPCPIDFRKI